MEAFIYFQSDDYTFRTKSQFINYINKLITNFKEIDYDNQCEVVLELYKILSQSIYRWNSFGIKFVTQLKNKTSEILYSVKKLKTTRLRDNVIYDKVIYDLTFFQINLKWRCKHKEVQDYCETMPDEGFVRCKSHHTHYYNQKKLLIISKPYLEKYIKIPDLCNIINLYTFIED